HGSGFLAVYLAGLTLGSAPIPAKSTVTTFHQGLAWVAQLTMFMVLGLLVFPHQLGPVALEGPALALILVFVARPVSTALAVVGRRVRQLGLPRDALLNVIVRAGEAIPPRGSTVIEPFDRLHVLVRQEVGSELRVLTERWQYGPFEDAAPRRKRVRGAGVIF